MASTSPADLRPWVSDKTNPLPRNALPQIVCGDGEASSKKPYYSFEDPQTERQQQYQLPATKAATLTESEKKQARVSIPQNAEPLIASSGIANLNAAENNQVRALMLQNAEPVIVSPGISNLKAATVESKGAVADAKASKDISVEGTEAGFCNVVTADGADASIFQAASADCTEARDSKTAGLDGAKARVAKTTWRKPLADAEDNREPQPVMGAVAWPALAETRNIKASEMRKSKKAGLKPSPVSPASAGSSLQESISESPMRSGDGSNGSHPQPGGKHKSSFKGGFTGSGRPAFPPMENIPSPPVGYPVLGADIVGSDQSMKHIRQMRTKGGFPATPPVVDHVRVPHHRNDGMGPFPNNTRKWRNNNRDHGRGNHGWHYHGRGYENTGDMGMLLHEQRIGPRNMPRPHPPYMNMNPGFYHAPNFQNGGMYYLTAGAPDFVHGAPYLPPLGPPAGMMHGPDPITLQTMILKQIDYYFSIENLCRDIYLRSNMDEQGFVPVSLIASFNRVRMLSSIPALILEALQQSSVVEVQHDRIRRRNDWGKWILRPNQTIAVNNVKENMEIVNFTEEGYIKLEQVDDHCGDVINTGSVPTLEGEGRQHCLDSSSALQENKTEGATFSIPLTDAESDSARSDRISSGACCNSFVHSVEDKHQQHCCDDSNVSRVQHEISMNTDPYSHLCFSEVRVGRGDGDESISGRLSKSEGESSPTSYPLQAGNGSNSTDVTEYDQESCLSASGAILFERSCMSLQSVVEENAGNQTKGKDLSHWTKNSPYFLRDDFESGGSLLPDSGYLLKSQEEEDVDHVEVNDRGVQLLINVTHAQLGSFIAVP